MWLFIPSQSAQAAQGLSLDSKSPVLVSLSPHCTLNGKQPSPTSWRNAFRKGVCTPLLSGLTCEQSCLQSAAESWAKSTASSAGSRVSRFPSQADEVRLRTIAIYGRPSWTSLLNFGQHFVFSRTCRGWLQRELWSTAPPSKDSLPTWTGPKPLRGLLASHGCSAGIGIGSTPDGLPSEVFLRCSTAWQVWKPWVTKSRSLSRQRAKSAQVTGGKDCSSWPTARGEDSESCGNHPGATDSLTGAAKLWTTPCQDDTGARHKKYGQGGTALSMQVGLLGEAKNWPTPKPRDTKGQSQRRQHGLMDALPNMAFHCSLPAQPTSTPGDGCLSDGQNSNPLWTTPASADSVGSTGGTTEKGGGKTLRKDTSNFAGSTKRRLNPLFVSWLMGFPPQWFIASLPCGRQEMGSYLCRQRGRLSALVRRFGKDPVNATAEETTAQTQA